MATEQAVFSHLGFMAGDPVLDLKLHHLALATRRIELKRASERVWSFLLISKHKVRDTELIIRAKIQ